MAQKEFDPFAEYPKNFRLPNGCTCFITKTAAGSREYVSDEIGGGVVVWDTALVDQPTLLACLAKEAELERRDWERHDRENAAAQNRYTESLTISSKSVRSSPEGLLHRIWQKIFPLG